MRRKLLDAQRSVCLDCKLDTSDASDAINVVVLTMIILNLLQYLLELGLRLLHLLTAILHALSLHV
jgi:hypothetical protein